MKLHPLCQQANLLRSVVRSKKPAKIVSSSALYHHVGRERYAKFIEFNAWRHGPDAYTGFSPAVVEEFLQDQSLTSQKQPGK